MKFLENHWASITCGRSRTRIAGMSRESFPELPQMPETIAEIPVKTAGLHDRADVVCDLDGRIALHAEWRAAAVAAGRADDGGDRRPPPGVCAERHRRQTAASAKAFRALVPKKAMGEIVKLADESGAGRQSRFSPAMTIICSSSSATGC